MFGLGSIIGAGASILGGVLGNKSSAKQASASRDFTAEQMQNRHQWETQDLKRAGLNRILSANSSPPIGASAMAQQQNVAQGVSGDMASMSVAGQAKQQSKLLKEKQTTEKAVQKKLDEEIKKVREDAHVSRNLSAVYDSQAILNIMSQAQAKADVDIYQGAYGKQIRMLEKTGVPSAAAIGAMSTAARSSAKGLSSLIKRFTK